MKIIQIGPFPASDGVVRGGIEASVYGLSLALAKEQEVVVLDVPRNEIKKDFSGISGNIRIYRFALKGHAINSVGRIGAMLEIIDREKPDVCHIHGTSLFAYKLWKRIHKRYRIVLTVHGLAHIEKKKKLRRERSLKLFLQYLYQSYAECRIIGCCREIIVDTKYVERIVRSCFEGKKVNKCPEIHVVPQGIDERYYGISRKGRGNTILSVGAINRRKGQIQLLQSFCKVRENISSARLVIAGNKTDDVYYLEVEEFIRTHGLSEVVELYSDVEKEKLLELYSTAEIFALFSEEESQGIVFCEAMAAGLPVVATKVGGIPDVIEEGVNGLLSAFGDTDSFARNMIDILFDGDRREMMGERNKMKAYRYNWGRISRDILHIYVC